MAAARSEGHHGSPLFAAIDTGNVTIVDALLKAGASVSSTNDTGETPLHAAVLKANDAIIRTLLARGADVDAQIEGQNNHYDGRTPLMNAAMSNHLPIVKLLLEHGADPFLKDASGHTALTFAEMFGKRVANHLRTIMKIPAAASELSLHDAATAGLIDRVARLLDDGMTVDTRDDLGSTALHRAAMSGHTNIVQLLLQRGVTVDAQNIRGSTALALAKTREVAQVLLAAGADPAADVGEAVTSEAITLLREELNTFAQRATEAGFTAAAEWIGSRVKRTPGPWKRRKGVGYFHQAAIDAGELERLQAEVRRQGFTLVYINAIPEENGRLSLILLPTANKFAAVLACGTNGINRGHDTAAVISWLMAMDAEDPFELIGCGHDFLHGRLAGPVSDATRLAERMIAFCPDMVEQAGAEIRRLSRSEQIAALAAQLSSSGAFDFWWD